ncbi:hypothetical protein A2733_01055 [Candidatus Nomurabacteria bacterium RIFCSPHIGHO2_01_FULL_40_20]|uniref:Aspartyl/glutamyl-tRNA(Asn/Gln) amidotransferase subunit C n=1 Tax=Candidatus Nomurabacteria bacterium RIFCSPHIGHO2_01_FULL_40_20 TaxID=1801738 RepID=A0A1F6V2U1_9BACT|nr:MAG: hypothetical protein A2733_01055 [Candidatus Nomurabacteria bacterium RIFCSPHIGHO2_01_FULL_40_20]
MNIKDVEALAETAKLELTGEEKEKLLSDMEGILKYLKQIEEVELLDIKVEHAIYNAWREDLPAQAGEDQGFSLDLITAQFPDSKDGFVKVKKIL